MEFWLLLPPKLIYQRRKCRCAHPPCCEIGTVRFAVRPQCKGVTGVCIAHPPVVTGDAFIVAAGIHAGLVVVRAFALTHQNAHSLRHIHRYAVKAAVRGKRQRVHRVLFRPLFRVFHALCNRIRMALSAVHKVVVQKRLFYIFRHVRFALTGFAAPVNHAVQVALIQCFFLPVQQRAPAEYASQLFFHDQLYFQKCGRCAEQRR